jgi:AcrR family transcriptional regulator
MARTQEQRRAETRGRLLQAAASLFAEHGIEAASVDAIADAADRTSGSVYAHFGGKAGLLTALVEGWTNDAAAAIEAEVAVAPTVDGRLRAIWRNFVDPPTENAAEWVRLEHELWLYASRHPEIVDQLAARYRDGWVAVGEAVAQWAEDDGLRPVVPAAALGPLMLGLLLGLEMQHRLAPDEVTEDVAVAGLRALLGVGDREARARRSP